MNEPTPLTQETLWMLDRLQALIKQRRARPQDWLEAIWWAAELYHGGFASYLTRLLGFMKTPLSHVSRAPCACGDWSDWLRHIPADHEARSQWMGALRDHQANLPLTVHSGSPDTWFGCPVQGVLHGTTGDQTSHQLPLHCAQNLSYHPQGHLALENAQTPSALRIMRQSDKKGWFVAARQGLQARLPGQVGESMLKIVAGQRILFNEIPHYIKDAPTSPLAIDTGRPWRPPPQTAPALTTQDPLEALRAHLYPSASGQRTTSLLEAWLRCKQDGLGDIATQYLAEHMQNLDPLLQHPQCNCRDWKRWFAQLPDQDWANSWVKQLSADASTQGLPCASAARLVGPLPFEAHAGPLQQFPLCGTITLGITSEGTLSRDLGHPHQVRIEKTQTSVLFTFSESVPPGFVSSSGPPPLPGTHTLTLDYGDTLHLDRRTYLLAHRVYGHLSLMDNWNVTPDHSQALPLLRPQISLGRNKHSPRGHEHTQHIRLMRSNVSRWHCMINFWHGRAFVRDLQSSSGVSLNGSLVRGYVEMRPEEDILQIGDYQAKLHIMSPRISPQ